MAAQMKQAVADFDHPLQMLNACHDRIRTQCETLRKLAVHLPVHGCDAEAQRAASNVMRYFDSAGRHHREDEEENLFPFLMAAAQEQNADRLSKLVDQLHREHHELEQAWLKVRETLEPIAYGENTPLDELEVGRFCGMYHAHMAIEDVNLIPLAQLLLSDEALAALGRSMAARRGINSP